MFIQRLQFVILASAIIVLLGVVGLPGGSALSQTSTIPRGTIMNCAQCSSQCAQLLRQKRCKYECRRSICGQQKATVKRKCRDSCTAGRIRCRARCWREGRAAYRQCRRSESAAIRSCYKNCGGTGLSACYTCLRQNNCI